MKRGIFSISTGAKFLPSTVGSYPIFLTDWGSTKNNEDDVVLTSFMWFEACEMRFLPFFRVLKQQLLRPLMMNYPVFFLQDWWFPPCFKYMSANCVLNIYGMLPYLSSSISSMILSLTKFTTKCSLRASFDVVFFYTIRCSFRDEVEQEPVPLLHAFYAYCQLVNPLFTRMYPPEIAGLMIRAYEGLPSYLWGWYICGVGWPATSVACLPGHVFIITDRESPGPQALLFFFVWHFTWFCVRTLGHLFSGIGKITLIGINFCFAADLHDFLTRHLFQQHAASLGVDVDLQSERVVSEVKITPALFGVIYIYILYIYTQMVTLLGTMSMIFLLPQWDMSCEFFAGYIRCYCYPWYGSWKKSCTTWNV